MTTTAATTTKTTATTTTTTTKTTTKTTTTTTTTTTTALHHSPPSKLRHTHQTCKCRHVQTLTGALAIPATIAPRQLPCEAQVADAVGAIHGIGGAGRS
jgi:hypothetical protein